MAGLTLALVPRSPRVRGGRLPAALRPFAVAGGGDIRLELTDEAPPAPRGPLLFDSGAVWRVHRHRRGLLYTFRTPALEPALYKAVAVDAGLRRGTVYFPRPRRGRAPRHVLDFPLDELLFQHRLARSGAFEVHACGVEWKRGAVLFCGRSGAGKSTTARLWRRARAGARILSDDRVAVVLRRGRPWAFGTPWHGEGGYASPAGVPLRAVFFLEHASRTRTLPLAPAAAAARLFARTFPPPWDARAVARVLAACARVAQSVPCHVLRFRPEPGAVRFVRDLLDDFSTSPTR